MAVSNGRGSFQTFVELPLDNGAPMCDAGGFTCAASHGAAAEGAADTQGDMLEFVLPSTGSDTPEMKFSVAVERTDTEPSAAKDWEAHLMDQIVREAISLVDEYDIEKPQSAAFRLHCGLLLQRAKHLEVYVQEHHSAATAARLALCAAQVNSCLILCDLCIICCERQMCCERYDICGVSCWCADHKHA